jgi:hypothetical protein
VTAGPPGFELRAVAHLVRPWGVPIRDLEQLRAGMVDAPVEVLFHHAVQYQLRHPGAGELPPDDFSAWIGGVVQDGETAERLSFAVQSQRASPDAIRSALLGVLDAIPAKRRAERGAPEDGAFLFRSASSLSFPTGLVVRDGGELLDALAGADPSVWFFHLTEEPWSLAGRTPLLEWLRGTADRRLAAWLAKAAESGRPIEKARARVMGQWRRSGIARRLAEATTAPEHVRREAARRAAARLVRRRRRSGDSA